MSHLKEYKTNLKNLKYLKEALNRINVSYHISGQNIILPQTKEKNASFCWNGDAYLLIYDMDFWAHPLTVNSFTKKVICEYSAEKVVHEMTKFGFSTEFYQNSLKNKDYNTVKTKNLILSRYVF